MIASQTDIRSTLNDLIQTCKDGQEGFRAASESVKDSALKSLLSEFSIQRSRFAGDLQSAARQLGDKDPEDTGTLTGALHRGWINLKGAIAGHDMHKILAECEAGEDAAVREYSKALELDLPRNVAELIAAQYSEVQSTHNQIRTLRDSLAK